MAKHHIEHHEAEEVHHHHYKKGGKAHRARGGKVHHDKDHDESMIEPEEDLEEAPDVEETYAGGGSNVVKEAHGEHRKRGGRVHEEEHEAKGEEPKHHAGKKPRRAHGGSVGAERNPLSGAAKERKAEKSPY